MSARQRFGASHGQTLTLPITQTFNESAMALFSEPRRSVLRKSLTLPTFLEMGN